ncbi:tetratricopeptide repeat protein [Anabaena sp. UHCC 0451]|uniref:tetratricopeptide repeat protein n=1 Tax=Anabaena sp. UHCC 0451 TaxID=2055235 RepID=UPI002B201528|nr:tetratricopeptide repeat protein [Anabaena sp. UHCC 0451]MEA5576324.1 tetratricopeptide repeat protein [Anabaena sp. UHCC 0451]
MDHYSFFSSGSQQNQLYKDDNKITTYTRIEIQGSNQSSLEDKYLRSYALKLAHQGDYTEAIALLNQLIDNNPQNAADYNNRGLIYFQSGEYQKALGDYNTAMQLNPKLASVYNNRANYYAACGELSAALMDYDQALDLNPRYVRAWINRGITLRDLGQYQEAIDNFETAMLFGQLQANIWAERGRTYHLWGDWNCAIADYYRALAYINSLDKSENICNYRLRLQLENWLDELLFPQKTDW